MKIFKLIIDKIKGLTLLQRLSLLIVLASILIIITK